MAVGKVSKSDRKILRELAHKQIDLARSDYMLKLKKKWIEHNGLRSCDPVVTIELDTFYEEVIPPLMKSEGKLARSLESTMHSCIVNHELFCDDTLVKDYFPVISYHSFIPFGIEVKKITTKGLGHHFIEQIKDLKDDFHLLKDSKFSYNLQYAKETSELANDIFGDILPAKIIGSSFAVSLTQNLVHIMSMETLFYSMHDYPELFKEMMQRLTDDYIKLFEYLEKGNSILSTTDGERLFYGSYCYNDFLPSGNERDIKVKDIWGVMESQETVGVSPDMFNEFVFPYYKRISERFGALSYGCCEPVDPLWDMCLSGLGNMRKLSISPWCNEEFMGERLRGKGVIYLRKPSPNFLGVGTILDEDAVRKSIRKTVKAAKGIPLEISQRDVYTINKDISKVKRYIEIIRSELSNS